MWVNVADADDALLDKYAVTVLPCLVFLCGEWSFITLSTQEDDVRHMCEWVVELSQKIPGINKLMASSKYRARRWRPQTCVDILMGDEQAIDAYLADDPDNFILGVPTGSGVAYECHNLANFRTQWTMDPRPTDHRSPLTEFKECTAYFRQEAKPGGRVFVKMGSANFLVLKPSWIWRGPVPEPRVFILQPAGSVRYFISTRMLPRPLGDLNDPANQEALGVDKCTQPAPTPVFRLVSAEPAQLYESDTELVEEEAEDEALALLLPSGLRRVRGTDTTGASSSSGFALVEDASPRRSARLLARRRRDRPSSDEDDEDDEEEDRGRKRRGSRGGRRGRGGRGARGASGAAWREDDDDPDIIDLTGGWALHGGGYVSTSGVFGVQRVRM